MNFRGSLAVLQYTNKDYSYVLRIAKTLKYLLAHAAVCKQVSKWLETKQ